MSDVQALIITMPSNVICAPPVIDEIVLTKYTLRTEHFNTICDEIVIDSALKNVKEILLVILECAYTPKL